MDYQLARSLKDAGFPQIKGEGTFYAENGIFKGKAKSGWMYRPTLEELIEACGDKFATLSYAPEKQKIWVAAARYLIIGKVMTCDGSTASVAVANLWLALHPKK